MVAQVDEQQRRRDRGCGGTQPESRTVLADVAVPQRAAGMGTVTVHGLNRARFFAGRRGTWAGALVKNGPLAESAEIG